MDPLCVSLIAALAAAAGFSARNVSHLIVGVHWLATKLMPAPAKKPRRPKRRLKQKRVTK